jgi:phage protein U
MQTFATLGGVKFELPLIETINENREWNFKEQDTVADKSTIQFVGSKPRTLDFKARIHARFADPEVRKKELEDLANKAESVPFQLANGKLVGYFVITGIATVWLKTDSKGNAIFYELALKLKEAAAVTTASNNAAAAQAGLGEVKKVGIDIIDSILGVVAQVDNVVGQALQVVDTVNSTIQQVQRLDPIEAIRRTVAKEQQALLGRVPNINEALRRIG